MLTQEYLKSVLSYDSDTGKFFWIVKKGNKNIGDEAGYYNHGYTDLYIDNKHCRADKIAWLYTYNMFPNKITHINGNLLDNSLKNLRLSECTRRNTSGTKHVIWHKQENKWQVQIRKNNKLYSFGLYNNISDAITAKKLALAKLAA